MSKAIKEGTALLKEHYEKRLYNVQIRISNDKKGCKELIKFHSPMLKKGNAPRIFSHEKKTKHVIVLTHGFTDSPYYVEAIGKRFYNEGCNVILPLLPGHGLNDPTERMEDLELSKKWQEEIDATVNAAKLLGETISLGGFSTGAALSVNKVLRNPRTIKGGLFLFSTALDLGYFAHGSTYIPFAKTIARYTDGKCLPYGTNPYRYPFLTNLAGMSVVEIVDSTWKLLENKKIPNPVFIGHSYHDVRVNLEGIKTFMTNHVQKGATFILSQEIGHSQLVLEEPIELDLSQKHGIRKTPLPNPKFDWMMKNAIFFFKEEVLEK